MTLQKIAAELNKLADKIGGVIDDAKDLKDAVRIYQKLKEDYEALDKARKRVYHQKDRLEKHVLPEMFDKAGTEMHRDRDLKRSFYPVTKYGARMLDKEGGKAWLRKNNGGDLITETVNAGSLSAFLQEMIREQAIEPPADLIEITSYKTTGSSKYTPKD